jgi:dihydrofolate reductase
MKAILACDSQGGIGKDNKLPWAKLEGDLPRFKELTENQIVVMGRNTWESIPEKYRPLPNRINIVVSRQQLDLPEGVGLINDVDMIEASPVVWCIGGAELFKTLLPKINEIHLSKTWDTYDCDTFIDIDQIEKDFEVQNQIIHEGHTYLVMKRK